MGAHRSRTVRNQVVARFCVRTGVWGCSRRGGGGRGRGGCGVATQAETATARQEEQAGPGLKANSLQLSTYLSHIFPQPSDSLFLHKFQPGAFDEGEEVVKCRPNLR